MIRVVIFICGAFLAVGALTTPLRAATATFVTTDTSTQGSWKGIYGSDGFDVVGDTSSNNPSVPSYATMSVSGAATNVYANPSTDSSALQLALPASTGRIAADPFASTSFTLNVKLNDGAPHQIALYMVVSDSAGRTQSVTIEDAGSGTVLDTRPVSSFTGGLYLVWKISGDVRIVITNTGSGPAYRIYGPFPGWTANFLAVGPNGDERILFTDASGEASVFDVASSFSFTYQLLGPYAGWSPTALSVGPDNHAHISWRVGGRISEFDVAANGSLTYGTYGPY